MNRVARPAFLDPDRLFPLNPAPRRLARAIYDSVKDLPIVSPHGHTDPRWFADDMAFPDPAQLFVTPDHYVFRMLCSQGVDLSDLGVPRVDGGATETDGRKIWRRFAENFHLFRGTPSRMWLDQAFVDVFGVEERLNAASADRVYDHIADCLCRPEFRPRALFERFGIEVIATTESPLDDLASHQKIAASGWTGRVITAYRPDAVIDPEFEGFAANIEKFGALAGVDATTWAGYLDAHRNRRAYFKAVGGATSTDHGHPSARTEYLPQSEAAALFAKALAGQCSAEEADAFRGHMLTEMARMSLDDGLVMQIHPGSFRNHSSQVFARHGRDKGFDIPMRTDYVRALKPLLDAVGMDPRLTLILFTLDETAYSRELAPLAGVYPALRLGPAWWFFDSAEGMRRFRELTTETAGFYNTVGFNDDTRAFCSIPARHDVARRVDCAYLATLVATGRLAEDEAYEVAHDLTYRLAKQAYRL
ncbi:glucuronate isomerase [Roseinatronobacter monicus]|uniref:Uronate isomerase n=1 Tax=Roseinatronobacter monicus TaxID=393481 RepID=A0A543KGZ4_9RHOB|nr:glucuronate isomerase [Roseinatronobacter monicus]TQM94358.1 glucuronate isomerase [Roseinatronobacter monicus]